MSVHLILFVLIIRSVRRPPVYRPVRTRKTHDAVGLVNGPEIDFLVFSAGDENSAAVLPQGGAAHVLSVRHELLQLPSPLRLRHLRGVGRRRRRRRRRRRS